MFISHINTRWVHEPPAEVLNEQPRPTFHCASCDCSFDTLDHLRQHLRSLTHLNQSITCPFCSRGFATGSGVVSHLEHGGCLAAPHVNARTILKCMKEAEPEGYTTNLLAAIQPAVLRITYAARQDMYRCKSCGIEVTAPEIIRLHILADHKNQKYRCPNLGECDRTFSTLAAAVNHLEGERCGHPLQRTHVHFAESIHSLPSVYGSMGQRALQIPV